MRRRDFIKGVAGSTAAWPLAVRAQQAGKIYRIGFLANDPTIPAQPAGQAFLDGLREGGYVEGKNIIIERRFAEARPDRYAELAAELIRLNVDVLVTSATSATLAAKRATTTIPIVMFSVDDPVGLGIVASLAHPGGNVTGLVQDDSSEIAGKRLQLLKDVIPAALQVAVLLDPDSPAAQSQWRQLESIAPSLNIILRRLVARQASDMEGAFAAIGQDRPDALLITQSEVTFVNRKLILELANKKRLPTMCGNREYAEAGALLSYSNDRTESFRRAANYVSKILKGTKPTDLPVEQPTKYELVINLKTAASLNLDIPRPLLLIADAVIE
jgi:putative tryptophan/tyrosine transport system substrate-binding protein